MADLKDKAQEVGHRISEKATEIGHAIGEKAEQAADWAKEKAHEVGNSLSEAKDKVMNRVQETVGSSSSCGLRKSGPGSVSSVKERMEVFSSCGCKVGVVDHVEGDRLKLTKNDSPDGQHHFIPGSWIERVDEHVHLTTNAAETKRDWTAV